MTERERDRTWESDRAPESDRAATRADGEPSGVKAPDDDGSVRATNAAAGSEGGPVPDASRVVEARADEELVAAPVWATLILVAAPFVLGFLVIVALRWFL